MKNEQTISEWKEKRQSGRGCLINILSVVGAFIVLTLGVFMQMSIFGSAGRDGPGAALVIGAVFTSYYFIKKYLRKYFNKKIAEDINNEKRDFFDKTDGNARIIYLNGNLYEGEVNCAMRQQGKGKMIYSNGDMYEGEFYNDMRLGKGKMVYFNGDMYEGEFYDNMPHGNGSMKWSDDGILKGDWKNGKFHKGKGKMIYSNGDIYEGDFEKGYHHGKGKMIYSNGAMYEGEFYNDLPHGKGSMIWIDGSIAKGNWKDGKFNS